MMKTSASAQNKRRKRKKLNLFVARADFRLHGKKLLLRLDECLVWKCERSCENERFEMSLEREFNGG
jgi:hypothetical protein